MATYKFDYRLNWENLVFWPLSDSLTQQQKMKTIKKACSILATPTIHKQDYTKDVLGCRKEHAISVPILAGSSQKVKHKNY